ncbi:MAG TPA: hypothetical protein VN029_08840, partial [Sphingomonas sp.]|nr:hypothetical protein [Sphingomonas sp.]
MVTALVIALLQSVPVSPPPSPAWPGPDYAQRYAAELKRTCMSDAGVALVVESWQRGLEESRARQARSHQIETELGEAAYTKPIDVARLERAA